MARGLSKKDKQGVDLVVLCEDKAQWQFLYRFLQKAGWNSRDIRRSVRFDPKGSKEQYVREQLPVELKIHRHKKNHISVGLIVMTDGDKNGCDGRRCVLWQECEKHHVSPPASDDRVMVLIPTWHIETWLVFLNGHAVVETIDYKHDSRQADSGTAAQTLWGHCQAGTLPPSPPPALKEACKEYQSFCAKK